MEPLIKRKEVMALLGISRYTLNKYLAAGMPMVRITSHGRFVKSDVLDWVKRNAPAQGEGGHVGETMNQRQWTTAVLDRVESRVIPLVPEDRMATFLNGKLNISGTMRTMQVGEFLELPGDGASPWAMARKQGISIKVHRIAGKLYAERVK